MLTPSQSNPSPESFVSGPQECERRGWHRVYRVSDSACKCIDCDQTGVHWWGREQLRKQGDMLEELGNFLVEQGNKELRDRARVRAALDKL
jgi:hypothetical protein